MSAFAEFECDATRCDPVTIGQNDMARVKVENRVIPRHTIELSRAPPRRAKNITTVIMGYEVMVSRNIGKVDYEIALRMSANNKLCCGQNNTCT